MSANINKNLLLILLLTLSFLKINAFAQTNCNIHNYKDYIFPNSKFFNDYKAKIKYRNLACYLIQANLNQANLSRADLRGANLSRAVLTYANLRDANLSTAFLHATDLSVADLRGADLRWAKLPKGKLIFCYNSETKFYFFFKTFREKPHNTCK